MALRSDRCGVVELVLYENSILDEGATSLANALCDNRSVTKLSLIFCNIGDQGAVAMKRMLELNQGLIKLSLEGNSIGPAGSRYLADGVARNRILSEFSIFSNPLQNGGVGMMAPSLLRLTALNLSNCRCGVFGMEAFCQAVTTVASQFQEGLHVVSLNLSHNRIATRGVIALARVLHHLVQLRELNLEDNKIGDRGAVSLTAAVTSHPSVETIALSSNLIQDGGALAFAEVFGTNPRVVMVSLERNFVSEAARRSAVGVLEAHSAPGRLELAEQLSTDTITAIETEEQYFNDRDDSRQRVETVWQQYLHECEMKQVSMSSKLLDLVRMLTGELPVGVEADNAPVEVHLEGEALGVAGYALLGDIISFSRTITELYLDATQFGPDEAAVFLPAIRANDCISYVSWATNQIDMPTLAEIVDVLVIRKTRLDINFENNGLGDNGALMLAAALTKKSSLSSLRLARNNVGFEGCSGIAHCLMNSVTGITDLVLDHNAISDEAATELMETLKQTRTVATVSLRDCGLNEKVGMAIGECLKVNEVMTALLLDENNLRDAGVKHIVRALRYNRSLLTLHIRKNGLSTAVSTDLRTSLASHPSLRDLRLDANDNTSIIARRTKPQTTPQATVTPNGSGSLNPIPTAPPVTSPSKVPVNTSTASFASLRSSMGLEDFRPVEKKPSVSTAMDLSVSSIGYGEISSPTFSNGRPSGGFNGFLNVRASTGSLRDLGSDSSSGELQSELNSLSKQVEQLLSRKAKLTESLRRQHEKESADDFVRLREAAVQAVRRDTQPLPPLTGLTVEEKARADNFAADFHIQTESLEHEVDSLRDRLEEMDKQASRLSGKAQTHTVQLDELESAIKELLQNSKQGESLSRADPLEHQKKQFEEELTSLTRQKTSLNEQRLKEVRLLLEKLERLQQLRNHRREFILQALHCGQLSPEQTVQLYQEAVGQMERLVELREQVTAAQDEESRLMNRLEEASKHIERLRVELARAEDVENRLYLSMEQQRVQTRELIKSEELLRTRLNMPSMSSEDIKALIPRARERYQFIAPLVAEEADLKQRGMATSEMAGRFGELARVLDKDLTRRKELMEKLEHCDQLKATIDRKKENRRQINMRLTTLQEDKQNLEEDMELALHHSELSDYKKLSADLLHMNKQIESLEENKRQLGSEIDRLTHDLEALTVAVHNEDGDLLAELFVSKWRKVRNMSSVKAKLKAKMVLSSMSPSNGFK
eukprot:GILJ01009775.1.p1 GENE.GILJ01009775.1~~GILJ01009775.1.p1  ORF type:complete len:1345 (-),score=299.15 GILJ01009775.1:208-3891(-)